VKETSWFITPTAINIPAAAEKAAVEYSSTMETNMNLRALMFVGFAGFIAQPALAQPAPATTLVSFDSVLASGYEVKAVTVM
jgi:hypothetical protein